jgi:hypothetical protein
MTHMAMVIHYPRPEHLDAFIESMRAVQAVVAVVPGCIEVDIWTEQGGDAVVAASKWMSIEALMSGRAAIVASGMDVSFDDERESAPRQHVVYDLVASPTPDPPDAAS